MLFFSFIKRMLPIIFGIACSISSGTVLKAQSTTIYNTTTIKSGSSNEGNFILIYTDGKFYFDSTFAKNTNYFTVERTQYNGDLNNLPEFKKVAEVKPVSTTKQLQKLFSDKEIAALVAHYKLKNTDELLQLFKNDRDFNHYEGLASNIRLQMALGITWLDDKVENGITYVFKITRIDNTQAQSLVGHALQTAKSENKGLLHYKTVAKEAKSYNDTVMAIEWTFLNNPVLPNELTFKDSILRIASRFENDFFKKNDNEFLVFRTNYTRNGILMPSQVTRGITDSTIRITNVFSSRPEDEIMAWIVPEDIFGNQGLPSDTVFAYALSYSNAPLINELTTQPIVDGIRLSWPKLPQKPYIKGIQIQRYNNDDMLEDVATLPASDTAFNDYNVVIGQKYRYQVRALFAKSLSFTQQIPAQSVGSYTTFSKPMPPINLNAKEEGKNIRLDWDGSKVKGLYGYHVYRGYDGTAPTLLAGPITEATNYVDTSAELSGKSVYTYYVITENLRQEVSLPGEPVHIKPNRAVKVYPPTTVQTYYAHGRVNLTWDDARKMDSYIIGYQVQRRTGKTGNYENLGAVVTFAQTIDSAIAPGIVYEYRVASIGSANEVSKYSDATQFELPLEKDFSKVSLSLRNTHKGVAINWPAIERPAQKQYVLYRRTSGIDKMEVLATLPLGTSNYTDEIVNEGKSYVYAIALEFDDATTGPLSNTVSIKHKPAAKPEILK